jgi:hypothetical protein
MEDMNKERRRKMKGNKDRNQEKKEWKERKNDKNGNERKEREVSREIMTTKRIKLSAC